MKPAFLMPLLCGIAAFAAAAPGGKPAWDELMPDFLRLQFAGQVGIVSLGMGYEARGGQGEAELAYGFVPAAVGGLDIHTLSAKATLAPFRLAGSRWQFFPLLLGGAANFPLGEKYRLFQEERFRNYYWPSGLYFWIFAGAKTRFMLAPGSRLRGMAVLVEAGTVDAYSKFLIRNRGMEMEEIVSLAIAAQFLF